MYVYLRKAREKIGLTQKDLAKKANITTRGYQNYEMGIRKPSVDTAIKIAKVLGGTVEELFSTTE